MKVQVTRASGTSSPLAGGEDQTRTRHPAPPTTPAELGLGARWGAGARSWPLIPGSGFPGQLSSPLDLLP